MAVEVNVPAKVEKYHWIHAEKKNIHCNSSMIVNICGDQFVDEKYFGGQWCVEDSWKLSKKSCKNKETKMLRVLWIKKERQTHSFEKKEKKKKENPSHVYFGL